MQKTLSKIILGSALGLVGIYSVAKFFDRDKYEKIERSHSDIPFNSMRNTAIMQDYWEEVLSDGKFTSDEQNRLFSWMMRNGELHNPSICHHTLCYIIQRHKAGDQEATQVLQEYSSRKRGSRISVDKF